MPEQFCQNPDCGRKIEYWQIICRCSSFVGFPNRRKAASERDTLMARAEAARAGALARAGAAVLGMLRDAVAAACPTINMPVAVCDDILRSDKYRTYDRRVDNFERAPATEQNHSIRTSVGTKLFPRHERDIVYAVLSPDGLGLVNYGPVAVRWNVTASYLEPRISLLEENSYDFYVHHGLGEFGAPVPAGYRAVWEDRVELAVAKLGPQLAGSDTPASVNALILHSAPSLAEDKFIEIHIFADDGLDSEDVAGITLQAGLSADDHRRFDLVREICARSGRAVAVSVPGTQPQMSPSDAC